MMWLRQADVYLKLLVHNVTESKLKCYVDADVIDAVRAETGDAPACVDLATSCNDDEDDEGVDDDLFFTSPKRATPSAL